MLQGFLMCIIATPIFFMNLNNSYDPNIVLSILWWAIALFWFFYEMKADKQLADFIKIKKKGQILTTWLRKFHRYPQYFWESIFWLGISIIGSQVHMLAFIWWIVITLLLRFVSGVPLLEKRYQGDKTYAKYSEKIPVFLPAWNRMLTK